MSIQRVSNDIGGTVTIVPLTGSIPTKGYYLIGDNDAECIGGSNFYFGVAPDDSATTFIINDNDLILLVSKLTAITICSDAAIIDKVGLGSNACTETTSIGNPGSNNSVERKAHIISTADTDATTGMYTGGGHASSGNSQDANLNAFDFIVRTTPEPQNTTSTIETP